MDHHESTESGLRDDGDAKGPYMTKYYTVFEVEPSTAPYKRVGSQGLRAAASTRNGDAFMYVQNCHPFTVSYPFTCSAFLRDENLILRETGQGNCSNMTANLSCC